MSLFLLSTSKSSEYAKLLLLPLESDRPSCDLDLGLETTLEGDTDLLFGADDLLELFLDSVLTLSLDPDISDLAESGSGVVLLDPDLLDLADLFTEFDLDLDVDLDFDSDGSCELLER